MTIIDNLNELETNIASAKQTLATNISAKGVAVTTGKTLTEMATAVSEIQTGVNNEPYKFSEIGYTGNEFPYAQKDIAYAKKIYDEWGADQYQRLRGDTKLVYMPLVDCSNIENAGQIFLNCTNLEIVPDLNLQNAINIVNMFYGCENLKYVGKLNTSKCKDMSSLFISCPSLEEANGLDLSSATDTNSMFSSCYKLRKVNLMGNPAKITNMNEMFGRTLSEVTQDGELTYDCRYDYSKVIEELKKVAPNWKIKTSYIPQTCTSLTITADDCVGNATTTTVHYIAVTTGIESFSGEKMENFEVRGDVTSEPFEKNLSETDSKQVTVSYTYLGQTATTTITQNPQVKVYANLMDNWELAPNEETPNPDPSIYEGVYQSKHPRVYGIEDKMIIEINHMPNFELYIRSDGESYYNYINVGKLDQAEVTNEDRQDTTYGERNSSTSFDAYKKVIYPNDGGQHTVTVLFKVTSTSASGTCRGYVFFKKPDVEEKPQA